MVHVVTAALITIAFGMGLGLEINNFRNIFKAPKGVLLGMVGQLLILPMVAIILASFAASPIWIVGLILIGVCPGGSSSNYFTSLARGDVALSVSLTALSGMLSIVSVPFLFNIASGLLRFHNVSFATRYAYHAEDISLPNRTGDGRYDM